MVKAYEYADKMSLESYYNNVKSGKTDTYYVELNHFMKVFDVTTG